MIEADDYLFIESRFDLESHIKIKNGRLEINDGSILRRPQSFPTFMFYNGTEWIEDFSGKQVILEHLYNQISSIQETIKKIEKVESNG